MCACFPISAACHQFPLIVDECVLVHGPHATRTLAHCILHACSVRMYFAITSIPYSEYVLYFNFESYLFSIKRRFSRANTAQRNWQKGKRMESNGTRGRVKAGRRTDNSVWNDSAHSPHVDLRAFEPKVNRYTQPTDQILVCCMHCVRVIIMDTYLYYIEHINEKRDLQKFVCGVQSVQLN